MDEEAKTKVRKRAAPAKAPLTLEAAQDEILTKLSKAETKGTASPHRKATASNATIYEQALAILQDEKRPEIFVDRRGKKPKYYLWKDRPKVATAESVARQLLEFARSNHPRVHDEKGFIKKAGIEKAATKLVAAALEILCQEGQIVALKFAATVRKTIKLFAMSGAISPAAKLDEESPEPAECNPTLDDLKPAYDALFRKSGFPAVPISALRKISGVPAQQLKDLLRREHDQGRVVLSAGDWSMASEEERRGVIEMDGSQYLQVRWR